MKPERGKPARTAVRGNCYVATEALWHILGGKASSWNVMRMPISGDTHWFLKHRGTGEILDPSVRQFKFLPPYIRAVHTGFLTKQPSKRAQALIDQLTWQPTDRRRRDRSTTRTNRRTDDIRAAAKSNL